MKIETLIKRKFTISFDEVANGVLDDLINSGLDVLTLCMWGQRSQTVAANLAFNFNLTPVAAVCLLDGISQLHLFEKDKRLDKVITSINRVPVVATILHEDEYEGQEIFIRKLIPDLHWYSTPSIAVRSIISEFYE